MRRDSPDTLRTVRPSAVKTQSFAAKSAVRIREDARRIGPVGGSRGAGFRARRARAAASREPAPPRRFGRAPRRARRASGHVRLPSPGTRQVPRKRREIEKGAVPKPVVVGRARPGTRSFAEAPRRRARRASRRSSKRTAPRGAAGATTTSHAVVVAG
jgi:hypothetical protein